MELDLIIGIIGKRTMLNVSYILKCESRRAQLLPLHFIFLAIFHSHFQQHN